MGKKKLISISVILCLMGVGVYAAPTIIEKIEYATAEIQPGSLTIKHNLALREIVKEKKGGMDVQEDVEAYARFLAEMNPTEEEIRYIDELIGKGYRARDLVEIFTFWQDTQEDLSIIEEVYAYRPPIDDVKFWVDSAFIKLAAAGRTKGQFSCLSVEEVKAYYESGISYGDIMTADRLSRHGTKEIKEILSDKQADISWYEIIDGVYNLSTPETREADIAKYKNIKSADEILASKKLAERNVMPLSEALDGVMEENSSALCLAEKREEKKNEIKEQFVTQGLWVETTEETVQ